MKTVEVKLMPKQMEFLRAKEREVLYSGAFGAGKTRALCYKLLMRASTPGAVELLCRKHNVTLKRSTLLTLLEPDGDLPPVLLPEMYEHNKSEQVIRLHGGGKIIYFGIDDPNKLGSTPATGVAIDEVVELSDNDYMWLSKRARVPLKGLDNQIYMATNPDSPSHHIAQRFGITATSFDPPDNRHIVKTDSLDNPYLRDDYKDDLNTLTGINHKRYVLGLWVGSDKLVFDTWDRAKFVIERDRREFTRFVVGVDEGYTNPGTMLVFGVDGDGRTHQIEEVYACKQIQRWWLDQANRLRQLYAPEAFIVDSAAAGLIAALSREGHNAIGANKDRVSGINAVRSRLVVAGDGRPRHSVDPSCVNTIREFETYENKTDSSGNTTDEASKENDHCMDPTRYVHKHLLATSSSFRREPNYRK